MLPKSVRIFTVFACLSLCALGSAPAQKSAPPLAAKSDRYAGEAAVIERAATVYAYAADGTGTKQITVALRVQSEAAVRQFGVVTIAFAAAEEHVEFDYVRIRRPDGTVVETPASEAQEMSSEVTRQAPLYSDLKEKQLPVRSLRVGDTLEYQVRTVRTVAQAPGEIWGTHAQLTGIVSLDETVEIRLPASKAITVWSPTSKPVVKDDAGNRIYRWSVSNLDPTAGPEADAKKEADKTRTVTPAEAADLQYGKLPLIAWTTFKSWDAVGAWYRSLETGRAVADSDIKAKVAEVIKGKTTDEEKVRAIYNYVATNIRYIGVDLGVGRYQPHLASEVLRNQYGDCKDKHTLLAAMLIEAGFHPSAVLVGAGFRFNPDVPSPASFNHLITQLPALGDTHGEPVWLDSTIEVAPYRALISVIRDKDALVIPPAGVARIEKTPANLPYPSVEHFEATGTLTADGILDSHMVMTLRGDDEVLYRIVIHQISPGQYGDFVQGMSQNLGFAGTASHPEIGRPESTAEPLRIAYDYKREKPGDWDKLQIYPQFPPLALPQLDEKDPPKIPIPLGLPRIESATSQMKLPEKWGATLPADIHLKTAFATFDKTYRLEKGILYADRKLEILKSELPASDWKSFKKFTDDTLLNNEPTVQLVSPEGGVRKSSSATKEDALALLAKAQSDTQARQFDEALADLDKAKSIDPQQVNLYAMYAFRSAYMGELADAIKFDQKELQLHPDNVFACHSLADEQVALKQTKAAEQSLRECLTQKSPDQGNTAKLAELLMGDEDYSAAIAVIEASKTDALPSPRLKSALGRAYLKTSRGAQGTALLSEVIENSNDAEILDRSAHELADANVGLDVAETGARKAVAKLAEKSGELTIDSSPIQWQPVTRQVLASWDTLGWVLFHEHKLSEAESYIHAAWMLSRQPEAGLHLGQLQEAKGDINAALTTYVAAAGGTVYNPESGPGPLPPSLATNLADRIAALRKKGAKPLPPPANKSSIQMGDNSSGFAPETVSLGPSGDANGPRQFTLLLDATGVVAAKGSGPSELKNEDPIIHRLETKSWWPGNSPVNIVRQGMLLCQQGSCVFAYFPM